jgi:hypothetical protein
MRWLDKWLQVGQVRKQNYLRISQKDFSWNTLIFFPRKLTISVISQMV